MGICVFFCFVGSTERNNDHGLCKATENGEFNTVNVPFKLEESSIGWMLREEKD